MVQLWPKWKCIFFSSVVLFNVVANSLPTTDFITDSRTHFVHEILEAADVAVNASRGDAFHQSIRPGQTVASYIVEITVNDDETFNGLATLIVRVTADTRDDDLILHSKDLNIKSVKVGVFSAANAIDAEYIIEDDKLYISPAFASSMFFVVIEYTGHLANGGLGLHLGRYNENSYVAMNLHPTYARRVFPCMDETDALSSASFKFNNLNYAHVVSNTMLEDNSKNQFRPLVGPPNLSGMIAHNFVNTVIPAANVVLFGREGIINQDQHAAIAINSFYMDLNEWTNKPYTDIDIDQDGRMNILALPDVSTDWNSLSIVGIWEPYVLMENNYAEQQRSLALPKIAEAIAKPWFGYAIYAENKRYEWVVSGLASYAGWEAFRKFHGGDVFSGQLDVNALFVTDVIQESLLRDSYSRSRVLEPEQNLFDEDVIRDHMGVNSVLKYKAPALMRMLRLVLGGEKIDYIQLAAQALLNSKSLSPINSLNFIDAVNYSWLFSGNRIIDNFQDFLEPWIKNNGYPVLNVIRLPNIGVLILQESQDVVFQVPITYTTRGERNFDAVQPVSILRDYLYLPMRISANDWILFNIQGQGYYRVNYDFELWDLLISTLQAPSSRNQIHTLNRATLVDDSLNLARAGKLEYDVALRVVLTLEHETDYAVWKAFVRNMDFLRKRLVAYAEHDDHLDSNIYLRVIQKAIRAFEENIGFNQLLSELTAMQKLTKGLVMEHACRANYQPCITAAKNWFYNPDYKNEVNSNIPHEVRPAVYCTVVREGDSKVIEALLARMDIEPTLYERLVILESLACSQDESFIKRLLEQTVAYNSPYGVEERLKIFAAVAGSSYANADLALNFMTRRTSEIRKMYGGPEKLEEAIFILADNMADEDQSKDFEVWVHRLHSHLEDSEMAAERALQQVYENLAWDASYKENVYKWIAENAS